MTTSRIVRGNKGRIFAYVLAVVFITGVIACYNNTLSQLDEAKLGKEVCQRESENLSTQLQMISDYKQRLEKSLKAEKAEHTQSRKDLQTKLDEEKAKNERTASQIKLQLSSLQQSYQLLQTQNEDFKQKCADNQQEQASEINQLQATLKEAQEELKKVKNDKEKLKNDYVKLQEEKDNLEQQIKNTNNDADHWKSEINRITKENNILKRQLGDRKEVTEANAFETLSPPSASTRKTESSTNFSKQVSIDDASYQIRDDKNKPADQNVADQPPANVRNEPNEGVLPMPNGGDLKNTPSSKGPTRSSSKMSLDGALPLRKVPTVTPESAKENQNMLPLPYKRLPDGVVDVKKNENLEEIGNSFPNRYRNEVLDSERANEEKAKRSEQAEAKIEEIEKDNGAHEELDFGVAGDEKNKMNLDVHHNINELGIMDSLRNDAQERAGDVDQNEQLEEEDDDDENNEPAIRN